MHNKHYTLLLLAALTYVTTAIAQPRIKDQGVIGGDLNDQFSTMHLTNDGGLIVGGSSFSNISDQKTQNSRGGQDYWVVKLDSNRQIQWDRTVGGNASDFLNALQQTSDGGYILGGTSYSDVSGDKTEPLKGNLGQGDYWLVKLDAAGNIQWDKTIGGKEDDELAALQQTADGGYILGGYSASNASGDKTQNSKGHDDYWILKLDATGNIQWDKTIGGGSDDYLFSLGKTADGGYILGGTSFSSISGDKTENSRGIEDYWIVKLDAAGNIQWDRTIGGSNSDYLWAVQQINNGGYILGGYSKSDISGEKTDHKRGNFDYWVVKLDAAGNIQWDKTIGGDKEDRLKSLQQTIEGGYILGGWSSSNISGEKTEASRGTYDYWVVKINSSGKVQWNKTVGGDEADNLIAILELKKNDYIAGGYSFSGISGDKTGGRRSNIYSDYWLVELKYVKPDSIATTQLPTARLIAPQQSNTTFSIYPNPVSTVLHIQNMGKATFILSDQSGKRVSIKTLDGNGDLSVANVPAGTYYLTNTTTGITQKLIITK